MKNVFRNLSTLLNVRFKVGKMVTRSKFSADPLLVERNSPESSLTVLTFWQISSSVKETRERFAQALYSYHS